MRGRLEGYRAHIAAKRQAAQPSGFGDVHAEDLPREMRPHQKEATAFALRQGRSALFLDTGLGKTLCELVWADAVVARTNRPVLMLSPLAVAGQHAREAARFGVEAHLARSQADVRHGAAVYLANYERLHLFEPDQFAGVILDESGILKSFTGATSRGLIEAFAATPFRLAGTATPAPNDHMELGQHSDFLGAMQGPEMLSRWFISDQTQMGRYRLKAGAVLAFWDWVASWARCAARPSDLGFSDEDFELPPLKLMRQLIEVDRAADGSADGDQLRLFRMPEGSATALHQEKRLSLAARADCIASRVAAEPGEPWVIWCDTDYEADALGERLPNALEVRGSMPLELKEERLLAFSTGELGQLITKPRIAGYGLNWQHCARQAFVGVSYSYEAFYQAVRRCWRYGQARPVEVHAAVAETELGVWSALTRKGEDHRDMQRQMTAAMARAMRPSGVLDPYQPEAEARLPAWLH